MWSTAGVGAHEICFHTVRFADTWVSSSTFLLFLLLQTKPTPSSECKPADESGGGGGGGGGLGLGSGDQGWNMGQDDSAVHGKHLPPSPRRQPNKSSMKVSKKPAAAAPPAPVTAAAPSNQAADVSKPRPPQLNADPAPHHLHSGRQPGHRFSYSPVMPHRLATTLPSPTLSSDTYGSSAAGYHADYSPLPGARSRTISDPQTSTEPPQTQNQTSSTGVLRRKVLSKETVRQYQEKALQRQGSRGHHEAEASPAKHRHSAMPVPWEKEVSKEGLLGLCLGQGNVSGAAVVQDQGLLEEIESMCCLSSVLNTSLQLSQVHCNNSHHQVQGKATDES